MKPLLLLILLLYLTSITSLSSPQETTLESAAGGGGGEASPSPSPWPVQFHAVLWMNYSGALSLIDLWYDWPNGRNLNLIRDQLADDDARIYDVEWNNGTSFFFPASRRSCRSAQLDVGILRPDWLRGARYLGRRRVDGFLCDAWEKLGFIWYYEDVLTKRPVHWIFYTGRAAHVMTFEVGAVLEDSQWQAPAYCFENKEEQTAEPDSLSDHFEEHLMQMRALKPQMGFSL